MTMHAGRDRPPLFLASWAGGEVLGYRELVEKLDADLPVYGLRAPGVDGECLPLRTIEETGRTQRRAGPSRVQPYGPYHLIGYCYAAVVVFEMARQLVEQGEELAIVGLIDAHLRVRRPTRLEIERMKFEQLRQSDFRGKTAWIRRRVVGIKNKITNRTSSLLARSRTTTWPATRTDAFRGASGILSL